jgi:hypothetical protein
VPHHFSDLGELEVGYGHVLVGLNGGEEVVEAVGVLQEERLVWGWVAKGRTRKKEERSQKMENESNSGDRCARDVESKGNKHEEPHGLKREGGNGKSELVKRQKRGKMKDYQDSIENAAGRTIGEDKGSKGRSRRKDRPGKDGKRKIWEN